MREVVKKALTDENIVAAIRLLRENGSKPYEVVKDLLDKNGFSWDFKDARTYADEHNDHSLLNEGLFSGSLAHGVSFIANARSSALGYSYCQDLVLTEDVNPNIDSWLEAAEGRLDPSLSQSKSDVDRSLDSHITADFLKSNSFGATAIATLRKSKESLWDKSDKDLSSVSDKVSSAGLPARDMEHGADGVSAASIQTVLADKHAGTQSSLASKHVPDNWSRDHAFSLSGEELHGVVESFAEAMNCPVSDVYLGKINGTGITKRQAAVLQMAYTDMNGIAHRSSDYFKKQGDFAPEKAGEFEQFMEDKGFVKIAQHADDGNLVSLYAKDGVYAVCNGYARSGADAVKSVDEFKMSGVKFAFSAGRDFWDDWYASMSNGFQLRFGSYGINAAMDMLDRNSGLIDHDYVPTVESSRYRIGMESMHKFEDATADEIVSLFCDAAKEYHGSEKSKFRMNQASLELGDVTPASDTNDKILADD